MCGVACPATISGVCAAPCTPFSITLTQDNPLELTTPSIRFWCDRSHGMLRRLCPRIRVLVRSSRFRSCRPQFHEGAGDGTPKHERQRCSRSRAAIRRTIRWTGWGRRFEEGGGSHSPHHFFYLLPNPPLICSERLRIAVEKPEEIGFENRYGSVRIAHLDEDAQKIPG